MAATDLLDFRDALRAAIVADETYTPELVDAAVVKAQGADAPEDITQHVETAVAKSRGLALVLYAGAGRAEEDGPGAEPVLLVEVPMELYVHRLKYNARRDAAKRTAEEILLALIKLLHGAEIEPAPLPCYERLLFRSFTPLRDPDFEAWELTFQRQLHVL